jgi:hypothetical protein
LLIIDKPQAAFECGFLANILNLPTNHP